MKNLKKLLLVSFDFIKENEPNVSYSNASLKAYVECYAKNVNAQLISVNIEELKSKNVRDDLLNTFKDFDFNAYTHIGISVFIWSEKHTGQLLNLIKEFGFNGEIILGGAQISYSNDDTLLVNFPSVDYFVKGYGEQSLLNILNGEANSKILKSELKHELPMLYSSGIIPIRKYVRLETKRGCPFSCSFCSYKSVGSKKVICLNSESIKKEILYLNSKKVEKVNIIDPIFNMKNSLEILDFLIKIDFKPVVSIQARFEFIKGKNGKKFLKRCEKLNVILEFGLQTTDEKVSENINRPNDITLISEVIKDLNKRGMVYEVNLIYGLPGQTFKSFMKSVKFLIELKCKYIVAFPLSLLPGTKLFKQKNQWGIKVVSNRFSIPLVIESIAFSKDEYILMKRVASKLNGIYYRSKVKCINDLENNKKKFGYMNLKLAV